MTKKNGNKNEKRKVGFGVFSAAMGDDILNYFFKEDEERWRRFAAMEPMLDETGSVGEPESSVASSSAATTSLLVAPRKRASILDQEETSVLAPRKRASILDQEENELKVERMKEEEKEAKDEDKTQNQ
jgi:hypothetical protein